MRACEGLKSSGWQLHVNIPALTHLLHFGEGESFPVVEALQGIDILNGFVMGSVPSPFFINFLF
jgi:hypothetical protein